MAGPLTPRMPAESTSWLQEGLRLHRQGQLVQAKERYQLILARDPAHFDALQLLAVLEKQLGNHASALELFDRALRIKRSDFSVFYNRGNTLLELGRFEEALASHEQALRIKPDHAAAHNNRGLVLQQLRRLDEALESYAQALRIQPDYANACNNRGSALKEAGRLEEALASYGQALRIKSDHVEALNNQGVVLHGLGRFDEALASYDQALRIRPDYADAHSNRGLALQALERFDEALESHDQALRIRPGHADGHNNRANTLKALERLDEALASYELALRLEPGHARAYNNRGVVLKELRRFEAAVASYDQALRLEPGHAEAHNNRGVALQELRRFDEALASYQQALRLEPGYAGAWLNRGNLFKDLGEFDEALACYRRAIDLDEDLTDAHSNLLFTLNYIAQSSSGPAVAEARVYGRKVSTRATPKFTAWPVREDSRRLRVGLVSGDLRNHPVGYFIEGWIQALDVERLDIVAFPTSAQADDLTARLRSHLSGCFPLFGKSDLEAARLIHAQGIHVLIDLSGHTAHNRLPVFSYRPAPVQVSWLGYFATTGLPEMDYFLGDPWMLPSGDRHHFTEKIWNLAETWFCRAVPSQPVAAGPLPALEQGFVTFGSFGNLSKMNAGVVEVWAGVLRRVRDSRLFLKSNQLSDARVAAGVQRRFAEHGIGADRLILEGASPPRQYFEAYNRLDVVLDTFPYPGGTTSVDALWMGVPVLTLKGDRFLSRLGESIAVNAGQAAWIAQDPADYVDKAVLLTADLHRLAGLRQALRERMPATPLFDNDRFARNFEQALLGMWAQGSQARRDGLE